MAPTASLMSTPAASTPVTWAPMRNSTPNRSSLFGCLSGQAVTEGGQRFFAAIEQDYPHRGGLEGAELASQAAGGQPRTWPASSTPVGPAPTMATVSHRSCSAGSVGHFGHLEGPQDAPAQLQGVVYGLHSWRVQGVFVVAEVGLVDPGGHDEAVIRRCRGRPRPRRQAWTRRRSRSKPVTSRAFHPHVFVFRTT